MENKVESEKKLTEKRHHLTDQLNEISSELAKEKESAKALQVTSENLEQNLAGTKIILEQKMEQREEELLAEVSSRDTLVSTLRTQVNDLQGELQELTESKSSVEHSYTEAKATMQKLLNEAEEKLHAEVSNRDNLINKVATQDETIQQLHGQMSDVQEQVRDLTVSVTPYCQLPFFLLYVLPF